MRHYRVAVVARALASSARQVQRAFEEVGETSFSAVLREARLRAAAELLSQQPLTVRQVSLLVGYRQPAHFAKAFRRRWGVTPAQYPDRAWRVRTRQETMEDSSDESTKGLASLAWLSRCWRSD